VLLPTSAAIVLAHPLGNFTINHYAGIRVEPDRVRLDVVVDRAEIPTFQVVDGLDTDGDGRLTAGETVGVPVPACLEVAADLRLAVDGAPAAITLVGAGASFPPGNGGLPTMRLVCELTAPAVVGGATRISLRDEFSAARIGWREMTAVGSGVTVLTAGIPATSLSTRLTAYPTSLASAPDVRELTFDVRPGGPILPDPAIPDAAQVEPVTVDGSGSGLAVGETVTGSSPGSAPAGTTGSPSSSPEAAVPGGAEALPDVLRRAPVDPLFAIAALVVAAALGAGHALTPGHGKTLMAAYLVGTRGTRAHALGLGLTVSVTHTIGILILALVVLAAETALPADLVVRLAPLVAAASIVAVGTWMLLGELRRRRSAGLGRDHGHAHGHAHGHSHGHEHQHDHELDHEHDEAYHEGHAHAHEGRPMRWRGLAVLGLAGGLIPSANALLILLGTMAAGRAAWGVLLVGAFGLGMAAVMSGIGLAAVGARSVLDRASGPLPFDAARRLVPLATSLLVLGLGVVLSAEAIRAARLA
jgi:ABC-type nickel/cobalt efflux system permease component RcnA